MVHTIVLPKIQGQQDLDFVSERVRSAGGPPVKLVASIESARALFDIGSIAGWKSKHNPEFGGSLSALLVSVIVKCNRLHLKHF